MNVILIILIASIGLQLTAAFLALRLIRVTGRRTAWMLIAIAIFFMALRRCITLFHLLSEDLSYTPDLSAEVVALVISLLMVFGIAWIAPLFLSIRSSEEGCWMKRPGGASWSSNPETGSLSLTKTAKYSRRTSDTPICLATLWRRSLSSTCGTGTPNGQRSNCWKCSTRLMRPVITSRHATVARMAHT